MSTTHQTPHQDAIATPGVFGPAYFREIGEVLAASAGSGVRQQWARRRLA